jgi:hypothetical protein
MSSQIRKALFITFLIAIASSLQGMASAACGTEYSTPVAINQHNYSFFPANETGGVLISASIQRPWCAPEANYLCYNSSSSYACYKDDTKVMTLIDEGQGTDFNRESLDPSLLLWMNMSGSGDDASLYRFPSTSAGTLSKGEGVVGYGMNFNSAYYDFGDKSEFDGLTNITVMGWLYTNESGTQHLATKVDNSATCGWALDRDAPAGECVFAANVPAGYYSNTKFSCPYATWIHLVGTYDGDYLRLYINGTKVAQTGPHGGPMTGCPGYSLRIGRTGWDALYLTGALDDVRIYNRTLSDEEISDIYNSTSYPKLFEAEPIIPIAEITFVPPTPENEIVTDNYTFINITIDTPGACILEWAGVNESLTEEPLFLNFHINKTLLTNGNYTFRAWCNTSVNGLYNVTEMRWVYINYTAMSIPNIVFVSPTPNNEVVSYDYAFINLTASEGANCILEWNGVNESMFNISENYYLNKTWELYSPFGMYNGNYTFRAYCDNAAGMNMTEERWVYLNRTGWDYRDDYASATFAQSQNWVSRNSLIDFDYNTYGYKTINGSSLSYLRLQYGFPPNVKKLLFQFKIGQSGSTCEQTSNLTYPLSCLGPWRSSSINVTYVRLYSNYAGINNGVEIWCSSDNSVYTKIFSCQGQPLIDNNIWDSNFFYGYGDAPETAPIPPTAAFISPTPINEIVTTNYTFINVSMSIGGECQLEWNGVNESMTNNLDKTLYLNKTSGNGNYTFIAYCQDGIGTLNNTETRWVFINYTAPPTPPTPPSPVSNQLPFIGFIFGFMGVLIALGILDMNIGTEGKDKWKEQLGTAIAIMIGVILVVLAFAAL